jgi:cytochrome P450
MRARPVTFTYPPDYRNSRWSLRRARRDPLAFLERLARSPGDAVPFALAGRPAILVKHPDLVEAVLVTQHQSFTKTEGLRRASRLLGTGLLTAEGERHRRQRAVMQPMFHRQRIERHAEAMVARAAEVRDAWQDQKSVDVAAEAGALTLAIAGHALFGADLGPVSSEIRAAVKAASDALDPLISLLAPARKVVSERERLTSVVDGLVERQAAGGGDGSSLIALLLAAQNGTSDIPQVRDDALTILLAGHDTIASALVWTWTFLAAHPTIEQRLEREVDSVLGGRPATAADVQELVFTRSVLAESLRLRPPAWVVARTPVVPIELAGHRVPAGAIVLISQWILHRDPRYFPEPDVFDPDRWLEGRQHGRSRMAYIPFGAGPRACIGEGFAWMEGVLLLATFAQRWRFRMPGDAEPRPHAKITLRPPPDLRMIVRERVVSPAAAARR